MSDTRWFEIDAAVTAAIRHFTGAVELFARLPAVQTVKNAEVLASILPGEIAGFRQAIDP